MANTLEQRGFFWWFNEPNMRAHSKETSIPGLLTVTENGQTTLQIDGALCENDEHADWLNPRSFPATRRIGGLLDTPGDYVLLEGLERTDFSISDELPRSQTFTAEVCTKRNSAFPEDFEQNLFVQLRINLKGLEEWLELESLLVDWDYRESNTVLVRVSYKNQLINFPVSGGTISIESVTTGPHPLFTPPNDPVRDVQFEQSFYIVFRPESPTDLQHLRYIFSKIEELLALLLGSYYHLARPIFVRKEEPIDSWITIYTDGAAPSTQPPNRFFYWVPFRNIRDYFGQLFEAWLTGSETFGAGFYLYIASLRNPHVYAEDRLFTLATGLEALHRKWFGDSETSLQVVQEKKRVERILNLISENDPDYQWLAQQLAHAHEPSLRSRIIECLSELPLTFGKNEIEKFAKACATRRNDISHAGGPRGDRDYNDFHQEIIHLAEALGCLFHGLLLHKIGLPKSVLFETMTRSWVAERHIKPALTEVGLKIQN